MVRLFGIALAALLVAGGTEAQSMECRPYEEMKHLLHERNMQDVSGLGVTRDELGLVELYVNNQRGFSVVLTDRNKMSCLLLQGTNWEGVDASTGVKPYPEMKE